VKNVFKIAIHSFEKNDFKVFKKIGLRHTVASNFTKTESAEHQVCRSCSFSSNR